jgi:hypothetical protein
MEKEEMRRTLDNWAHSGFNSAASKRDRYLMSANNTITDFQKSLILSVSKSSERKPDGGVSS